MKTDEERGAVGTWARKERLAHGLKVEAVVERLAALGTAVDVSYLRAIESGSKRPRTDSEIVAALQTVYRSRVPQPVTASAGDTDARIAQLVGIVETLVGELRSERAAREAERETFMHLLERLAPGSLTPLGDGDDANTDEDDPVREAAHAAGERERRDWDEEEAAGPPAARAPRAGRRISAAASRPGSSR